MADDFIETLKGLQTNAVDARNGYEEALEDAEGQGMTPLFRDMIAIHEKNEGELAAAIARHGGMPDDDGSLMSVVHEGIMKVRALFGGLDESVVPGLIDGEKRNVAAYDKALGGDLPADARNLISEQRGRLIQKITAMSALKQQKEAAPAPPSSAAKDFPDMAPATNRKDV